MIFLIEYDRMEGQLVGVREFENVDRPNAESVRLARVLELHGAGIDHDVVLLEAENKKALRKTHRRYFDNFTEEEMMAIVNRTSCQEK